MNAKGVRLILLCVMITLAGGCDNVAFGGIQVELRPPPGSVIGAAPEEEAPSEEPDDSTPLELGPVLYLVETLGDSRASILPIAELSADGYRPLPDLPNLVQRFPLQRLEGGEEFALFFQGARVGTFLADGTVEPDSAACFVRPRGSGRVELRPEMASYQRFLALTKGDLLAEAVVGPFEPVLEDYPLRNGSAMAAQRVIERVGALWPSSIPDARRSIQPIVLAEGASPALAATFVHQGSLEVGEADQNSYSIFLLAQRGEAQFEPIVAWYQRAASEGKAFPRLLAAHDVRRRGSLDMILEVFGEEMRWFTILGEGDTGWQFLYQDPCAPPTSSETLQVFP